MNLYLLNLLIIVGVAFILLAIKNHETRKKLFLLYSFIQLFLFLGFRSTEVGIDLQAYIPFFNKCSTYDLSYLMQIFEPGYVLYNVIIAKIFNNNEQIFLIITAFISLLGPYYVIKKYSKNYFLSVFLYITFQFYIFNFYLIRQVLALSILLLSLKFVKEKSFIKFLLMVLLASTIHSSAICFIVIYFLAHIKMNLKNTIILSGISVVVMIFCDNIINLVFSDSYSLYLNISSTSDGYGYLMVLLIIFIVATLVKNKIISDGNISFWYNICYFSIFIQVLATIYPIFNRFGIYFAISIIILLPNALKTFKDKKIDIIGSMATMVAFILFFMINLNSTNIYEPYQFFFQ